MAGYIGNQPVQAYSAGTQKDIFVPDGTIRRFAFQFNKPQLQASDVILVVNNVIQNPGSTYDLIDLYEVLLTGLTGGTFVVGSTVTSGTNSGVVVVSEGSRIFVEMTTGLFAPGNVLTSGAVSGTVESSTFQDNRGLKFASAPLVTDEIYAITSGLPTIFALPPDGSITANKLSEDLKRIDVDKFTATAGQTLLILSRTPATADSVLVFVNGVFQTSGLNYTLSGTNLTFTEGLQLDDKVQVVYQVFAGTSGTNADFVAIDDGVGGANYQTVQEYNEYLKSGSGASDLGYTPSGTGAVKTTQEEYNKRTVYPQDFMTDAQKMNVFLRLGTLDVSDAIQKAIDSHRGKIVCPAGAYGLGSKINLREETILVGEGAGAYFAGGGYPRITSFIPLAGFADSIVFDADPANIDLGLSYIYGVAFRDFLVDCTNIKNSNKTIFNLKSLSNAETSDSIRIINNNSNIAIRIGISSNASALESDGLSFNNIYCLQEDSGGTATDPVLLIEAANEVSFRDSKFQRGSDPATASNSKAVLVSAVTGRAVNGVTFDSCSFTGGAVGLRIQGNATDGQGPRWIRCINGTFEGPKFPIYISGTASRLAQFCVVGPGNRFISLAPGGTAVVLDLYSSNNQVFVDEFSDVLLNTDSSANIVYGGGAVTDNGTNNVRISRNTGAVELSSLFREATIAPTLAAGWTNGSPTNRTSAGYWIDSQGVVHLQGYVSYGGGGTNLIFTLPAGYVPLRAQVLPVVTDTGFGSILVNQIGSGSDGQITQLSGGTGFVSLDGLSFALQ